LNARDWLPVSYLLTGVCIPLVDLALRESAKPISAWMRTESAPGWVQAVGSVVAIAIAIAVPAWQAHSAEADHRRRRHQRLTIELIGLDDLVHEMHDTMAELKSFIASYKALKIFMDRDEVRLTDWLGRLNAIDKQDFPLDGAYVISECRRMAFALYGARQRQLSSADMESAMADVARLAQTSNALAMAAALGRPMPPPMHSYFGRGA
jgi:hypothetical protein